MSADFQFNRRQILGLGASAVGIAVLPSAGWPAPLGGQDPQTIFRTAFAPGDPLPGMDGLMVAPLARHWPSCLL
ncbi:MAG: hypothetical protein AB7E95_09605 [Kiritimatiellales bacterium]